MKVTIEVHGKPAPQGSKRHVGNGVLIESSKAVKPWREAVKLAAVATDQRFGRTPIALAVTFYMPRPKGHYRTGKWANELRPAAPDLHTTKPDLDKLLRSTCDALTDSGIYADDSCVMAIQAVKRYARASRGPGATIQLIGA